MITAIKEMQCGKKLTKRQKEVGWLIAFCDVTTNGQNDQLRSAHAIASCEIKTPLRSMKAAIAALLDRDFGDWSVQQRRRLVKSLKMIFQGYSGLSSIFLMSPNLIKALSLLIGAKKFHSISCSTKLSLYFKITRQPKAYVLKAERQSQCSVFGGTVTSCNRQW